MGRQIHTAQSEKWYIFYRYTIFHSFTLLLLPLSLQFHSSFLPTLYLPTISLPLLSLTPSHPSRSHSFRPLSFSPLFHFLSPNSLSLTPPPQPKCIHSSHFLTTTLIPLSPPYSLNPPSLSLLLPFSPRLLMP